MYDLITTQKLYFSNNISGFFGVHNFTILLHELLNFKNFEHKGAQRANWFVTVILI